MALLLASSSTILQVGIGDLLAALFNPTYLFSLLLFVSGYVFLSLSARRTQLWSETNGFEKTLVAIGLATGVELIVFLQGLAILATLGDTINFSLLFYISAIGSSIIMIVVPLGLRSRLRTEATIRRFVSTLSLVLVYFESAIFSLAAFIIIFVQLYSPATRVFATRAVAVDAVLWGASLYASVVFYLIYTQIYYKGLYVRTLDAKDIVLPKILGRKHRNRVITLVVISFVISATVVALDYSTVAFTPQISSSGVKPYYVSSFMFSKPANYFLEIKSEWYAWFENYTGPCNMTVYEPASLNYTIRVPWSSYFAVNNAVLQYPNSTNQIPLNFSNVQSLSYAHTAVWQNMFVLNQSGTGISYGQSGINLNLSKLQHPSTATIEFVFFKIVTANISCFETLYTTYNSTGEFTNTQKIELRNGENSTVMAQILELPFYSARPYSNFDIFYNATASHGGLYLFNAGGYFGALDQSPGYDYMPPNSELNFTIIGSCNTSINNSTLSSGSCNG